MKKTIYFFLLLAIEAGLYQNANAQGAITDAGGTTLFNAGKSPDPDPMNGNGTLGNIYTADQCGLDYVFGSVRISSRFLGLPGSGLPAPIALSGIPATCAPIEKAYLWFGVSRFAGDISTPGVSITNPASATFNYTGALVGTHGEKCWGEMGTWNFRTDVTNAISGNGNYVLNITGISSNSIDGATLFIVYRDVNSAFQGHLRIDDGIITKGQGTAFTPATYNMTGISVCGAPTKATGFLIDGDFQFATHTINVGGNTFVPVDQFWNFDSVPLSNLTTATTSLMYSTVSNYTVIVDCFSLNVTGLYYQTTSCTNCQSTLSASVSTTPTTCGNNNGTATATPSTAITNLCAGNYTLVVSDATGCTDAQVAAISQPAALNANMSATPATCGSINGTATANISGGNGNYTYSWSTSSQNTQTATGLAGGNYSVTITDGSGCTKTASVTVPQSSGVTVNMNATQTNCGSSIGTATANPSGGSAPYTYLWSNGQTTSAIAGLAAGTYSVLVTDAIGCAQTQTASVTNANGPNSVMSQTNILCYGQCTGNAAASVSGGSMPYTYAWSNGQITSAVNNLCAGNYTVIVSDANGCTDPQPVTISEPPAFTINTGSTPATCTGNTNGSAMVTANGGTGSYTYLWNPTSQNTPTATGLAPGNYTLTVTDANGCVQLQAVTVSVLSSGPTVSTSPANILCNGQCTGSASATVTGGTSPYSYNWNNGQAGATASGLCAGDYTVTVTDSAGCAGIQTASITEPAAMNVNASAVHTTCGFNNGSATATVSGGTQPYTYLWNDVQAQATQTAAGLPGGNYSVTVTDDNGCTFVQAVSVNSSTGITAVAGNDITIIIGASATLNASGGVTYSWEPDAGLSNPNISNPVAEPATTTEYCAIVTDANGCIDTACMKVFVDVICGHVYIPNAFSPSGDNVNDSVCVFGNCIKELTFIIYNRWGEKVFETTDPKMVCWDGKYLNQLQNTGVYTYYLKGTTLLGDILDRKGNISLVR